MLKGNEQVAGVRSVLCRDELALAVRDGPDLHVNVVRVGPARSVRHDRGMV